MNTLYIIIAVCVALFFVWYFVIRGTSGAIEKKKKKVAKLTKQINEHEAKGKEYEDKAKDGTGGNLTAAVRKRNAHRRDKLRKRN